jgi:hypothetical protein
MYNSGIDIRQMTLIDIFASFQRLAVESANAVINYSSSGKFKPATLPRDNGPYDAATHSYQGDGGLRYRIPLMDLPSQRISQQRIANVKILLFNCRQLCLRDELPSTPEERCFWAQTKFAALQSIIAPFSIVMPTVYMTMRSLQSRIPVPLQGRTIPITFSLMLSEYIGEYLFPAHQLLSTALNARTPLGDAARAEWQRLKMIHIPFHVYAAFSFNSTFGVDLDHRMLFGGDIISLIKET